jgi:hypothetical protein
MKPYTLLTWVLASRCWRPKKLMWLPSITNVPMLLNLSFPIRDPQVGRTPGSAPPVRAPVPTPSPATPHVPTPPGGVPNVAPVARRDQGCPIRNTARASLFTVNSPFAQNVRLRRVSEAISLAGPPPHGGPNWGHNSYACLVAFERSVLCEL